MALSIHNLSIGYSQQKIIAKELNLSVSPGELVCLIGPNGTGKSTLLKTIAGLLSPLAGEIKINDKNILLFTATERAKQLAVVFTQKIQAENLDVYSAIATGRNPYTGLLGTLRKDDVEIIQRTIDITGLKEFENKFVDKLSDGEQQKVMIGRAIAQDCPIILLDEPTAHLDTVNKIEITLLLKKIAKEQNKSIIISTHDLSLALQIADKIWLMNKNRIAENTPTSIVNTTEFNEAFSGKNFSFDKNSFAFKII